MSGPGPTADYDDIGPGDEEPVGSLAEEAFKLFRAMSGAPHGAEDSPDADHVCPASWCPVCQVVGFVRDNPEAIASVGRSATALAQSLRDLVDAALSPQEEK